MALKQDNDWDGKVNVITGTTTLTPFNKVNHLKHGTSAATVTLPAPAECKHGDEIVLYVHPTGTNTGVVTIANTKQGIDVILPTTLEGEGEYVSYRCVYGLFWVASDGYARAKVVTDASMDATPGRLGDLAINTDDSKLWLCTVAGDATGSTWAAQT